MFGSLGVPELVVIIVILLMLTSPVVLGWVVFSKTGLPGALSLIALVPIVGFLVVVCILAFTEWPIERELRLLRQGRTAGYRPGVTSVAPSV
jgi:hypothetical protein